VPLTESTRISSRAELTAMKPNGVFINLARGGFVDEDASSARSPRACSRRRPALDVFAEEPGPDAIRSTG